MIALLSVFRFDSYNTSWKRVLWEEDGEYIELDISPIGGGWNSTGIKKIASENIRCHTNVRRTSDSIRNFLPKNTLFMMRTIFGSARAHRLMYFDYLADGPVFIEIIRKQACRDGMPFTMYKAMSKNNEGVQMTTENELSIDDLCDLIERDREKNGTQWRLDARGRIRAIAAKTDTTVNSGPCPIMRAYFLNTGQMLHNGFFMLASKKLSISQDVVVNIAHAADNVCSCLGPNDIVIRLKLLKVCGLA